MKEIGNNVNLIIFGCMKSAVNLSKHLSKLFIVCLAHIKPNKATMVRWMVSIERVLSQRIFQIDCGTCKRPVFSNWLWYMQEVSAFRNNNSVKHLFLRFHNCLECQLKKQCPFEVTFKISHFLQNLCNATELDSQYATF